MKSIVVLFPLAFLPQADRINYYEVTGRTAAEVRRSMNVVRPTDSHGLRVDARTTWDIHWTYRYQPAPAGCVVTEFNVTLTTAMTLPKYSYLPSAQPLLRTAWNNYYAALIRHEKGHVNIAELAQGAIREAGPRITAAKCSDIAAAIDRRGQEILAQYRTQEVQYDKETNHGMTQGAKFP